MDVSNESPTTRDEGGQTTYYTQITQTPHSAPPPRPRSSELNLPLEQLPDDTYNLLPHAHRHLRCTDAPPPTHGKHSQPMSCGRVGTRAYLPPAAAAPRGASPPKWAREGCLPIRAPSLAMHVSV